MHTNDKNKNPLFVRFIRYQARIWSYVFIGITIFMVSRTFMLVYFFDAHATHLIKDILTLYGLGLAYDLQAITFIFSPLVILGLFLIVFNQTRLFSIYNLLGAFFLLFIALLCVVNFFYYQYFSTQIGMNFFHILLGQADATFAYIFESYPVEWFILGGGLLLILMLGLLRAVEKNIQKINWNPRWFVKLTCIMLSIFLYISAMRCSFGGYSLYHNGFPVIASSSLVNQLVENGAAALYDAYKEIATARSIWTAITLQEALNAYNEYFDKNIQSEEFGVQHLYSQTSTKQFSKDHPKPNVVFVQMESFGRHLLLYSNTQNDMLGKLGRYFSQDFLFNNFLSSGNATYESLGYLTFNTPRPELLSTQCSNMLSSSVAKPFKMAGYKTVFLTSGSAHWANTDHFLSTQGFDQIIGLETILEHYPKAERSPWGVYDEYTFAYAYHLLNDTNENHQPIFIYINTVTNHPPYSIPTHYQSYPITLPDTLLQMVTTPFEELIQAAQTYQYANDSLGHFIDQIDHSHWGWKTIIGASGDHNQRELMFHYKDYTTLGIRFAVPFFLHVPPVYQNNIQYDPERIGSHKDIFPTLYELALSDMPYLKLGNNLLSPDNPGFEFGYNVSAFLFPEGIIVSEENKHRFYPWTDKSRILVGEGLDLSPSQKEQLNKVRQYELLLSWQLNEFAKLAKCT
ncbi:LTA synthase family protein [Legionella sainthelensi]|uniref:Sulfatase N-terminal domain-containing protein n=1 Tax=Legionella sainthelensi TaxID=28087 RepID=A0A2H5FHK5_9GAMM|nr:alkaline phosphatase family protein [Legionella sainthelensi]AUH71034.1 alkaline phosphatase family protein [Legionella sainthelensi]